MKNNFTDSRNLSLKFWIFIFFVSLASIYFLSVQKCYAQITISITPHKTITIYNPDIDDTVQTIIANNRSITTYSLPNTPNTNPSITDIRKLADSFGLLNETQVNPHLSFLGGDISYWHEQGVSLQRLNLEFAARKVVLTAADRDGVVISDQGQLSFAAQQIMAEMLERRSIILNQAN